MYFSKHNVQIMKVQDLNSFEYKELPLKLHVDFNKVFFYYKKYATDKNHPFYASSLRMLEEFKKYPELLSGFTDLALLDKYQKQIDTLLEPLFPEAFTNK